MPRNSAGTYSRTIADFVNGTVILADVFNTQFADYDVQITASLDRNGNGAMLAPMKVPDGSAALPTYTWANEPGAGFYRAGAADFRFVSAASTVQKWTTTGCEIPGTLAVGGALTVTGALNANGGVQRSTAGNLDVGTGANVNTTTIGRTGQTQALAGDATVAGTLAVTGTTTTTGALTANGSATFNAATTVTGKLTTGGVLSTAASLDASGATESTHHRRIVPTIDGTSGNFYPLDTLRIPVGANTAYLNTYVWNTAAATGWEEREYGFALNVDGAGLFSQLRFGPNGVRVYGRAAADASSARAALTLVDGHLRLSGTAPNSNIAASNTLTPANMVGAKAEITTNGLGAITLVNGYNIQSVAISAGDIVVTFAQQFGNTNYTPHPAIMDISGHPQQVSKTQTQYTLRMMSPGGGTLSFSTNAARVTLAFTGAH